MGKVDGKWRHIHDTPSVHFESYIVFLSNLGLKIILNYASINPCNPCLIDVVNRIHVELVFDIGKTFRSTATLSARSWIHDGVIMQHNVHMHCDIVHLSNMVIIWSSCSLDWLIVPPYDPRLLVPFICNIIELSLMIAPSRDDSLWVQVKVYQLISCQMLNHPCAMVFWGESLQNY